MSQEVHRVWILDFADWHNTTFYNYIMKSRMNQLFPLSPTLFIE